MTSLAFAIKIPSDTYVLFLFKVGFDNLELTQFFSENICFLFEVQVVPHPDTVDSDLSVICDVGREDKPNDGGDKQIKVTVLVVKSRLREATKGHFRPCTYPRPFSIKHILQVIPSKPVFGHEGKATAHEQLPVSVEPVRAGFSEVTQGEKFEEFEAQSMSGIVPFHELTFVIVPVFEILFVKLLGLADNFKMGLIDLSLDFFDVFFVEGVVFEGLS